MRADCTFDKTAGAAVNGTGNVLFHRCTFASTMVLPAASAPFAGALTATNGTQVALEATSFSGTTGGADVALDESPTMLFALGGQDEEPPFSVEGDGRVAPLPQVAGGVLNVTDARFVALMQARAPCCCRCALCLCCAHAGARSLLLLPYNHRERPSSLNPHCRGVL